MVAQGGMFEVPGDKANAAFPQGVRLCYAWEDEDALEEGVRRLARVLRDLLEAETVEGGMNGAQDLGKSGSQAIDVQNRDGESSYW